MKIIKDFDLYSPQWLEITFNKRNKNYGAYELRNDSSNRHIKAIIIVFFVGLFAIFLPKIVETITWPTEDTPTEEGENKTTAINMADDLPKEETVAVEYTPPPPIVVQMVKVTVIEITPDDLADTMKTAQKIAQINQIFGNQNVDTGKVFVPEPPPPPPIVEPEVVERYPDIKAEPPGGMPALMKFLGERLRYPQDALDDNVSGTVIVEFVVKADGTIGNVQVIKKVHPSLDQEAVRVVKLMEKWKPGSSNKVAVSSYFQLPVQFKKVEQPKN
ncbi:MAG: energy transducer TonB [Bacteroidetes bacterium]|nr:energy transducer TonB [Bacteroidota bacterium]